MAELHFPTDATLLSETQIAHTGGKAEPWDVLRPIFAYAQISFPFRMVIEKRLSVTDAIMQVYRVKLYQVIPGSHIHDGVVAVCKVAHGEEQIERLTKEANIYNTQLSALQDQGVPFIYGFFQGETVYGPTAVLLMDDCGVPLSRPLRQYPLDFRAKTINVLHDIHKAGVLHNDFSERNIVIMKQDEDGEFWPTVVDFGNSSKHRCGFTGTSVPINCRMPLGDHFGCWELWNACIKADIWREAYIQWFTGVVPAEWATTPEELVEKAKWPSDVTRERALRLAREEITELRRIILERNKYLDIPITWH